MLYLTGGVQTAVTSLQLQNFSSGSPYGLLSALRVSMFPGRSIPLGLFPSRKMANTSLLAHGGTVEITFICWHVKDGKSWGTLK